MHLDGVRVSLLGIGGDACLGLNIWTFVSFETISAADGVDGLGLVTCLFYGVSEPSGLGTSADSIPQDDER